MAVSTAKKWQKGIDQVYALGSLTKPAFGAKFDFIGAKTAVIYNLVTQALGNYTRTGSNRFGTPAELQDTVQELTITKDRSFSTTIDKGNYLQGNLVKTAGDYMKAEMNEQVTPELDTYNLTVLAAGALAASQVTTAAVTAANAYEKFLDGTVALDDAKVSRSGRLAFVTPTFYKFIRLDPSFVKASDMAQKMLMNGMIGEIDGVKLILVPTSYVPANTSFIITHPSANANPMQLEEINIHDKAPGISGALIEGRFIYDAFVLAHKQKACYQHKIA